MFTSYADFKGTDRLNSTTFLHSKVDSTLQFFPVQRKILKEVGRGGGGGCSSRTPGYTQKEDPSPKITFSRPCELQFGLKIGVGEGVLGPLPYIRSLLSRLSHFPSPVLACSRLRDSMVRKNWGSENTMRHPHYLRERNRLTLSIKLLFHSFQEIRTVDNVTQLSR